MEILKIVDRSEALYAADLVEDRRDAKVFKYYRFLSAVGGLAVGTIRI
jgi:hypothetical protein